jgi:hypothetical protein
MPSWRGRDTFICLCVNFFSLYVCGLFNDAVSSSVCIAPSRKMINDNLSFSEWVAFCLQILGFLVQTNQKPDEIYLFIYLFISHDLYIRDCAMETEIIYRVYFFRLSF